jgi:hypothetical protein
LILLLFLNSTAYVFERLDLRNLDVPVIYLLKESPAVGTDVQVAARPAVLVQLDLSGAAYMHEVLALAGRENQFEWGPIRLAHDYRIVINWTHPLPRTATSDRCHFTHRFAVSEP